MATKSESVVAERLREALGRLPDEAKALVALGFCMVDGDGPRDVQEVGQDFLDTCRGVLQDRGDVALTKLGFDEALAGACQGLAIRLD